MKDNGEREGEKEGEKGEKEGEKRKVRRVPIRLRELFAEMTLLDESAISTSKLTESFGWRQNDVRIQQDITELQRVLCDAISRSLAGTCVSSLVSDIYSGTVVNKLLCTRCNTVREREEVYEDVVLGVKGHASLYSSLSEYIAKEKMCGNNKYFCDTCNAKVVAYRWTSFRSLPPILTVCLRRFDFNWERERREQWG